MIKVVDVVYYCHQKYDEPQQVLNKQKASLGFVDFIKARLDISFIKHANFESTEKINGIDFAFFKSRNNFWHIPFKTHRYIKKLNPDIVIVEGLIFPLQLMMLKFKLRKHSAIIVQHHGEIPFKGIKRIFQILAGKVINTYLFTSRDNAKPWIKAGIISPKNNCRELLEASTDLYRKDKKTSQVKCAMSGSNNFLWVGRLDSNKDPVTVLKGFGKYAAMNPAARLYMIYQEDKLLEIIKNLLNEKPVLRKAVKLVGKVSHDELAYWYSAADFYISGSHKEGSGYALLEAMACGCIPVLTAIPSFNKITAAGKYGFLYPAGDEKSLAELLLTFRSININQQSASVEKYFQDNLGFKSIADELVEICEKIRLQKI